MPSLQLKNFISPGTSSRHRDTALETVKKEAAVEENMAEKLKSNHFDSKDQRRDDDIQVHKMGKLNVLQLSLHNANVFADSKVNCV